MTRLIKSLLVLLLIVVLSGCAARKKNYSELRGLMLLENTQIGRNRSYYSKHDIRRMENTHKKLHNKIKRKG